MKKLVSLLSILIISLSVFAQQIPRGANVIILKTSYSSIDEAITVVSKKLLSSGIGIALLNEKVGFLTTGPFTHTGQYNRYVNQSIMATADLIADLYSAKKGR